MMNTTILSVGDELISGEVQDTNGPYAARYLTARGIQVQRIVIVPDDEEAIASALDEGGLNLVGGGLGGTHDDLTRQGIARRTGLALEVSEAARALMPPLPPGHSAEFEVSRQRMATLPHGAEPVRNPVGVAPGFIVRDPLLIVVLPGIPAEFRPTFQAAVERLDLPEAPYHTERMTFELPESLLRRPIERTLEQFPNVKIGSYPRQRSQKGKGKRWAVEIRFRTSDPEMLEQAAAFLREQVAMRKHSDKGGDDD
ncbi:MAG: competence/damage-inducible protein A [Candidatus Bipolaricaulia bacterium]